ncbi:sulfatase [Sphingobacterium sp. SGG-5]|uniref:sulfatase family protein n=1 Tax=Sphingobacterium sp. SGG-5 TaxID=2710881 RepID=UPI0013EDF0A3|nr:sulfatase [Sphingobacterium sp. SGG-5]NGM61462.1 sulfatase [Sphingobacterium sp. SGG-5]
MKRIVFVFFLQLLVIGLYAQERPNIIIIYADDMGYGDLGINGHPNIRTPHLDRMTMEGVRFTNYYSASPACTASRYALLTGKYPSRAGFRWVLSPKATRGIHAKEHLLPEYLKEAGYRTAIFGKWHLGSTKQSYFPTANGFDEYVGLPYSNDMIPPKYPDIALLHGVDTLETNPDQSKLTKLYTDKAIAYIKSNKKQPFFVYIPYAMPHTPLFPGAAFAGKSKRGTYGDVVEELDHYVGQLMSFLKKEKLDKKTYVIFTSDNGPWLTQNVRGGSAGLFRDGKGSTWEGGMREPFIVWGHRSLPKGSVVHEVFTALDILPTMLEKAGIDTFVNPIDGQNLGNLLTNSGKGRDVFFYFGLNHELFAVRKGKWKLHVKTYSQLGKDYFQGTLPLLFNLDEDPSEKYNVASEHTTIVEELTQLIQEKKDEIKSTGTFWDQ